MAPQIYNNYSSKLRKQFYDTAFSEKDPLILRLLNIRMDRETKKLILPQSSGVDPLDRIIDPWAVEIGKDDKGNPIYEAREIDIAYVVGSRPAAVGSARQTDIQLGEIFFRRELMGMIQYDGKLKTIESMVMFLFFSNKNESNKDKPWHIAPRFGYIYYIHSKSGEQKTLYAKDRVTDKAYDIIDALAGEQMEKIKRGMFPNEYQLMGDEEVKNRLRIVARKTPEKILGLSKDVDVQLNAFITDMEAANLLKYDETLKQWQWPDTNAMLCIVKPGQTKISALKMYFMTAGGAEVMKQMEETLKAMTSQKAPDPAKTT